MTEIKEQNYEILKYTFHKMTCKKDASMARESLMPKRKQSLLPTISVRGTDAANSVRKN